MRVGVLAAGLVVAASLADAGHGAGSQPQLSLRATPRVGLSPTGVILTGQLQGGEDVEEFHCPALEWDWDDGSRSSSEEDCGPFQAGSGIARRFSARHLYRGPGSYRARLTLSRAGRAVAAATVMITVRGPDSPD
jgi:phosphate-selective porin